MRAKLEVCVDSLASARAAIAGGADRLELCSALCLGGLTPHTDLLRQIRKESNIEVRCMIRPREGDFLYSPEEIQLMLLQIWHLREMGADGFVIGALDPEGNLDEKAVHNLIESTQGRKLTLHRCVDVSRDLIRSYELARQLGFDTVLTSGGAANCTGGKRTIGKLLELQQRDNGPEVLVGAGVNAQVIRQFRRELPMAQAFHMSGRVRVESAMRYRREGIPMGGAPTDEWHRYVTDSEQIRQAKMELQA